MRVALKLGSWNVNTFKIRKVYAKSLIAHEKIDAPSVCETLQRKWKSVIVPPLKFKESVISMPAQ